MARGNSDGFTFGKFNLNPSSYILKVTVFSDPHLHLCKNEGNNAHILLGSNELLCI